MAFSIKRDIEDIISCKIPNSTLTNSLSLFDVLKKVSTTREKRLWIDIETVKDAYRPFKVNDIAFIQSKHIIADTLTRMKRHSALMNTFKFKTHEHSVSLWIIRGKDTESKSIDKESGNFGE